MAAISAITKGTLIKNVKVQRVLQPHSTLQAKLEIMPDWGNNWRICVIASMKGWGKKLILNFQPISIPRDGQEQQNLMLAVLAEETTIPGAVKEWTAVKQDLAKRMKLTVEPSYDMGKAAIFTLEVEHYESKTSVPLNGLGWFKFEG